MSCPSSTIATKVYLPQLILCLSSSCYAPWHLSLGCPELGKQSKLNAPSTVYAVLHTQRHGSGNNCCPDTMNSCAWQSSQDIGLARWTQSQAWYNACNRIWNSRSVKYITQQLARDWLQVCSYVCLAAHRTPCTSVYFVDRTAAAGPQLSSVCAQIRGAVAMVAAGA